MNRCVLLASTLTVGLVVWLGWSGSASGWVKRATPSTKSAPTPPALLPVPVATGRPYTTTYLPADCPPLVARGVDAAESRPLVWVLDGAGDLRGCSKALAQSNQQSGMPVELVVFPWSHGYRQLYKDQTDLAHAQYHGQQLASVVLERQAREPGRRVVIVAHSAGCAVALSAGESLPPDSVDRIVLLAPSVSTGYDLRPTLWAAREGVDVFCSKKDWVALGFVTRIVGTTDRTRAKAAGRHGFDAKVLSDPETTRLRQHFWTQELSWTGHTGGHHGMHAPNFVQTYLLPLLKGTGW